MTIDIKALKKWLVDAAGYFERRPTGGEDAMFWANVSNSQTCLKISAALLESDVRQWFYYPIIVPVNKDGAGPCDLKDATKLTWEVWDQVYLSHASFDNLPQAINEAMRLNREKPQWPSFV